ncbi:MAG: hypothetical protein Q4D56_08980 [Bacteroides sp.]|nr:hypothetical protein [Bacteroides sp.]
MLLNSFFYITREDADVSGCPIVSIRLNPEHAIYKAHFPGKPITPGVCQIQIVTEILSIRLGADAELTDIKSVKYMAVIAPDEVTELTVRFQKMERNANSCKVIVVFEKEEQIFSKMSMTYRVN